jgi:hypothetical protein
LLHEERASWQWLNDLRNNAQVGTDRLQADRKPKSNTFENRLNETQHVCKDGFDARRNGSSSYEIMFLPGQEPPANGFWSLTRGTGVRWLIVGIAAVAGILACSR